MLAPKRMSKLLIAGSRDQLPVVVAELYRRHLFHIEEYVDSGAEAYDGFKIGSPLPGASEASVDLIKIRSIGNAIAVNTDEVEITGAKNRIELKARIERELPAIEREVEALAGKRSKLETQSKDLEQKITELTPYADVPVELELLRGFKGFSVLAGYVAREVNIPSPSEVYFAKGKDRSLIIAVVPAEKRTEVEKTLQEASFQSIQVPEESGSAKTKIAEYKARIAAIAQEVSEITAKLSEVRVKHTGFLVSCEELLRAEVEQTEAPLRFATTKQTFVAEGWVPTADVDEISADLTKAANGKIFVTVLPIDFEHDAVPVEYNNPDFAKPAQMLTDIYSRPRYTEIDPTLMLAIVFPIFFGLILGDVGYGLILLIMCFGLRKFLKGDEGRQFLTVLRNASISSIIFGLLFSEFLGFALPWHPLIFSRHLNIGGGEHAGEGPAILELLIVSIWIGILQVTLGNILGMINHARQDHGEHRIKAVMACFGWVAVIWGMLFAIWSIAAIPLMPDLTGLPKVSGIGLGLLIGGIVILVGIACIARDSLLELVELPTKTVSHILSYARLVAVGLSSVAIAMVVNFMSIGMFIQPGIAKLDLIGIVMILIGLGIFLFGHALNTALGILGGGLHSIRLHYVEFFTKFYRGGGKKYNPFGMKRRFTEE